MGFFKSIAKVLGKTSRIADPVGTVLRKQGGALGTVGNIMNPGAAAWDAVDAGAPINARTMLDPKGWIIPTPPPPEAPPEPLAPLVPGAPTALPSALQPRPVQYSQPTTDGRLTNLAFQMSGVPTGPPPPTLPQAPPVNAQPIANGVPPSIQAILDQQTGNGRMRLLQMAMRQAIANGQQGQGGTQGPAYRPTPGGGVEPIFGRPQADLPMLDPLDIARLRGRTGMY